LVPLLEHRKNNIKRRLKNGHREVRASEAAGGGWTDGGGGGMGGGWFPRGNQGISLGVFVIRTASQYDHGAHATQKDMHNMT